VGNADRMPPIPESEWTQAQKKTAQELIAGPRGAVFGPFVPLLRSPEFLSRMQHMGEYLRFGSVLPKSLSEFVILLVSRQWNQGFEWHIHHKIAMDVGVARDKVEAIAAGRRPVGMSEAEEAVYEFLREIAAHKSVCDATYARVLALHGEQGVIDLTCLSGYYAMLAMVMNVTRTPVPTGDSVPLQPLPG